MVSRRRWRALVVSLLTLSGLALPLTFSGAVQVSTVNENAHTVVLSLPGPFNGCSFLDPGANQTTDAMLDLLLPSAFTTLANGTLTGQAGPIASAELTSLNPETVRYTVAPKQYWSNGTPFTGGDLLAWWQRAKQLSSVVSDGYRAIKTLTLSPSGLAVTAVFATPYADWNLLFRDVEAAGTSPGCAVSNLLTRPTLGPYKVISANANRVVLTMNTKWPLNPNRFGRVVINDSPATPKTAATIYASYSLGVSKAAVQTISASPWLSSRISSSNQIEELTFAPHSVVTAPIAVRQALSWAVQRQPMIDSIFGSVTFSPSVAASAIYSQGQSQYPGTSGSGLSNQVTTTTTKDNAGGLSDCFTCATDVLKDAGYLHDGQGWVSPNGTSLTVKLAVGPSDLDKAVAALVQADWTKLGVPSTLVSSNSEPLATRRVASSQVDAAIFVRPTTTAPSYAARSWAGPAYPDSYPSGIRLKSVTALYDKATQIFNPVTAAATWLQLDQIIQNRYWVRPLFTAPSLTSWSTSLVTVQNSFTIAGFVDQMPLWSLTPVTS